MTQLILILHFLAMAVGVGGSVASMITGITAGGLPPEARPSVGLVQRRIGIAAAIALALLWITGIWLLFLLYGGISGLFLLFDLKILAAAVLTGISIRMQLLSIRGRKTGIPPPPATTRKLGIAGLITSLTVVVLAVLSFN
ncbi:hypothetical protein TG4357_01012 [Thalassovita gelatinovora]|uniref:Integral membrane protein n=1 Tax=Thalassovita gelatinovora TaxID=53501 RepID=A0A0P1F7U0_THAGE|nr:hypothetical protein [Thalassovita gelatinovora]QIZ80186.1 hypothetical protein HFZ77_06720 [Thalassovita gelatinovora]CUH64005.1 hypothetical protein TG4357_01012 [Thalassovita gelatinovora]SEQ81449.1 hypothetical protein SAMN04488043_10954 [Thalassovita gelatinovora]